MASPKTEAMRDAQAELRPSRVVTPGTEVLPIFRTVQGRGRIVVGSHTSGMPYTNPLKDRSLRGKARRRARRGGDR